MRTTLTLEHLLECGCKLKTVIHTTYDGPFDLHGRVLKTWLAKTIEAHVCPKKPT